MDNSLNWKRIYERIFSVYPSKTQEELGKALGVSQDLVSNWKTGKAIPTWHVLEKIVTEKHVTWQWLLTGKQTALREGGTIYDRIRNRFIWKFGEDVTDDEIADFLHVSADDLKAWATGETRPTFEALERACDQTGPWLDYFVTGYLYNFYGDALTKDSYEYTPIYDSNKDQKHPSPFPHTPLHHISEHKNISAPMNLVGWPVRGLAAADESEGTRVPDTDDFDEPINPPAGLTCVPVIGDSMSPVILSGQYALIDEEREGFEADGGIVVASIQEPQSDDERKEMMTGTFVKRCYDGGNGLYYFTSINEYSPFSAWIDHCRIWPVIGVWFAGKGKPPKE